MGRYATYRLSTRGESVYGKTKLELEKEIEVLSSHGVGMIFKSVGVKWYNHKKDMLKISNEYTNILFILKGKDGEEWIDYFIGGKSQHCKGIITFEPFNENELI